MATKSRVSIDENIDFTQYLSFSGTQSAANTFLQIGVDTKITPVGGFILEVQEVILSPDQFSDINGNSPTFQYQLTRASKVGITGFADPDLIAKGSIVGFGGGAFVAGNAGTFEVPVNMPFVGKQIIAAEKIFVGFTSSRFATPIGISGRIYYKQVAMAKERILEILYG